MMIIHRRRLTKAGFTEVRHFFWRRDEIELSHEGPEKWVAMFGDVDASSGYPADALAELSRALNARADTLQNEGRRARLRAMAEKALEFGVAIEMVSFL